MWTVLLTTSMVLASPRMIPEQDTDPVGRTVPEFQAPVRDPAARSDQPRIVSIDEVLGQGKPVVLSFWASWCSDCRPALPALAALQRERPYLSVLTINVDRSREAAEAWLGEVSVELPVLWDPQALVLGRFDVTSLPTLFLLDADGVVRWRTAAFTPTRGLLELGAALDAIGTSPVGED